MTIAAELDKLRQRVKNSFTACQEKGAVLPTAQNTTTLPDCIKSISTGASINNQDKTITTNGTYTADTGFTGLGTVTVNVPSQGNVVEVIARGGAKNFKGKEKVLLNPVSDFSQSNQTTNSEYTTGRLYFNSMTVGVVNNTINGQLFAYTGNGSDAVNFFQGTIKDNVVNFTSFYNSEYGRIDLPPYHDFNIGAMGNQLYQLQQDGSKKLVYSTPSTSYSFSKRCYNGRSFLFRYINADLAILVIIEDDGTITPIPSKSGVAFSDGILYKGIDGYYLISSCGNYGYSAYKITKEKGWEHLTYLDDHCDIYTGAVGQPLDEEGNNAFLTAWDASRVGIYHLDKTSRWKWVKNNTESLPLSPYSYSKKSIVLPITATHPIADIFYINEQYILEHYQWDGQHTTKLNVVFPREDLGSYTDIIDFNIDVQYGIIIAIGRNPQNTKQCKIFISGLGAVFNKEYFADNTRLQYWGDSTLTGFVKSNEGVDDFGNTILKVNTTLDPNAETWTDIGKSFGFKTTVEKGSLE